MNLLEKMDKAERAIETARALRSLVNERLSEFNGVAAVIPEGATPPADLFRGNRVILRNVAYNFERGIIEASVTTPYLSGTDNVAQGHTFRVEINRNWLQQIDRG
jgi:hypothetical protein